MGRTTRRKKNRRKVLRGGGPNEDLLEAARSGDLNALKAALDAGADIEAKRKHGDTSLMEASRYGRNAIVRELLDRGANIEAADIDGFTSLMGASWNGKLDAVKELLDRGANIEAANKHGFTSLMGATLYNNLDVLKLLLGRGANIDATNYKGNTSLMEASDMGYIDVVKLLLEKGANRDKKNESGETAYDVAATQEIRDLIRPPPPEVDEVWGGFTQDDFTMFEQIFEDTEAASDFSICPICHSQILRRDGCMIISHKCPSLNPPGLDINLYNKYLTRQYLEDIRNYIEWCTICGRICNGHYHTFLATIDGPANQRIFNTEGSVFDTDCIKLGGGGLVEKLARFNAILKTAHEMQVDAGKITVREAKKRLVTAAWNAPLTMDKAALQAQLASKTFPTPISAFPVASAPVAAVAEAPAPNIPYPDIANPDLLPIVLPTGDDVTLLDEVPNAVQFRHKKADGVVNIHDRELIGIENLMINVLQNDRNKNFASAEFGECWNSGGGCTAKLYPDEIQDAINKSTLTPEVKAQYETILADYRAKFNSKFKVGGRRKGGSLQLRGTQMFPLATDAVADCPLPKKSGKRRTRRKTRKQKRKTGKRKTRK